MNALLTPSLGGWLGQTVGFAPATSYILGYLTLAGTLFLLFFLIRRGFGEKLLSSDTFGSMEYYLGMGAGAIRFLCILLATLAVLHAPKTSQEELDRKLRVQQDDLGSIYFPPLGQIQRTIFQDSITGRVVKEHLDAALLEPSRSAGTRSRENNIYRARERLVDDASGVR
jgi:hypothetical protein